MKNTDREQAIKTYAEIKSGKVKGVKMYTPKVIKAGSITFII